MYACGVLLNTSYSLTYLLIYLQRLQLNLNSWKQHSAVRYYRPIPTTCVYWNNLCDCLMLIISERTRKLRFLLEYKKTIMMHIVTKIKRLLISHSCFRLYYLLNRPMPIECQTQLHTAYVGINIKKNSYSNYLYKSCSAANWAKQISARNIRCRFHC